MDDLSAYEQQRLEHIRRNHEMLVRLGLASSLDVQGNSTEKSSKSYSQKDKRKKEKPTWDFSTLRRSKRLVGSKPEFEPGSNENFDINSGNSNSQSTKRRKINTFGSEEADDYESVKSEILLSTTEFLKEVRKQVQKIGGDNGVPDNLEGWKQEAQRRWGPRVSGKENWKAFVLSRMSSPPPPSPLDLLQEYFCADVWQLLCCVTLMSRVSSWDTKHRCISNFFKVYPTPSAFLDEKEPSKVKEIIHSLGLFDDRFASLAAITKAFLIGKDGENGDTFDVDLKENKVRGIGKFGFQSYAIFCKDVGATIRPDDKTLANFCKWRKSEKERE